MHAKYKLTNYSDREGTTMIFFLHIIFEQSVIIMVKAWFMDSSDEDQRLPHQLDPPEPVSLEDLKNCGVLYWKVNHTFDINFRQGKRIRRVKKGSTKHIEVQGSEW